jgi:acyl-CoA thioester hydrolase
MIANAQSSHRYSLRVYYEDTDAGGVVYHANYLRYAERARTEALRDGGIPHAELVEQFNLMFMVHRAEIDYVRPAMLDELLVVETETTDVGGATVLLRQTVSGPKGVCATLRIKLACVRIGGNKPARIPPRWRDAMNNLRHQGDAGVGLRHRDGADAVMRRDVDTDTQRGG